jgi:phosphatidylinositol kinase/protein kinase (PI-3  family)
MSLTCHCSSPCLQTDFAAVPGAGGLRPIQGRHQQFHSIVGVASQLLVGAGLYIVHLLLQGLELAVPGTYLIGEPVVTIAAFAQQLHVITSKQRPRKLTIHGSDGAEYMFLLKGHEDLRQVSSAL